MAEKETKSKADELFEEAEASDADQLFEEELAVTEQPEPVEAPQNISQLEAFLRGGAQGLTVDFADEIQAGAEAGLGYLTGDPVDYETRRDELRDIYEQAEVQHPGTYTAGSIAGGIAPVLATGGGSAMAQAGKEGIKQLMKEGAKQGAKYGAATGLGRTEEIEDLPQVAEDVAVSTALGAGTGAALPPALKGAGKVAKSVGKLPGIKQAKELVQEGAESIQKAGEDLPFLEDLLKAYRIRKGGRKVVGKEAIDESVEESKKLSEDLLGLVKKKSDIGKKKIGKTLDIADDMIPAKNHNEYLNSLEKKLGSIDEGEVTDEAMRTITALKNTLSKYKVEEGGKEFFKPLKISELQTVKKQLDNIIRKADKATESYAIASGMRKEMDNLMGSQLDEASETLLRTFQSGKKDYIDVAESKGIMKDIMKDPEKAKIDIADRFRRTTDDTLAGVKKLDELDEVLNRLESTDPELVQRIKEGAVQEGDIMELARKSKRFGFDPTGWVRNIMTRTGSAAGAAREKGTQTAKAIASIADEQAPLQAATRSSVSREIARDQAEKYKHDSKRIFRMSDRELENIRNDFSTMEGAGQYAMALENVLNSKSDREKNALLYGLQQQPAFRKLLERREKQLDDIMGETQVIEREAEIGE